MRFIARFDVRSCLPSLQLIFLSVCVCVCVFKGKGNLGTKEGMEGDIFGRLDLSHFIEVLFIACFILPSPSRPLGSTYFFSIIFLTFVLLVSCPVKYLLRIYYVKPKLGILRF